MMMMVDDDEEDDDDDGITKTRTTISYDRPTSSFLSSLTICVSIIYLCIYPSI
jgi:hypothetical protein